MCAKIPLPSGADLAGYIYRLRPVVRGRASQAAVPATIQLFFKGLQHLGSDRLLKVGGCDGLVGSSLYPGVCGFTLVNLLEAVHEFAEPVAQNAPGVAPPKLLLR